MTLSLRDLLPRTWRDAVLPRLGGGASPHPGSAPPWQPREGAAPRLRTARYEHEGRHHRLHLREHGDGSALVVVDARRIARVDAAGARKLAAWLESGAVNVHAIETELWQAPVLTGEGLARDVNAGVPGSRVVPEIPIVASVELGPTSEDDVVARVRRLAALAIPHVVLRPSDEAAAPSVVAAVRAAEDLGLVTGVAAPADFVDDGRVFDDLAQAGLDHLALSLGGAEAEGHDAVLGRGQHAKLVALARRAAALEVPLTGEIPLVSANWRDVSGILAAASALGMEGVTAWAIVDDPPGSAPGAMPRGALRQAAATLEHAADAVSLPVTWAAPVRARDVRGDIARGPRTDGDFGIRVLRDGTLLPPRASDEPAGRLDHATWNDVLTSPSWRRFLHRATKEARCAECPGLVLCSVDCPAASEGWS